MKLKPLTAKHALESFLGIAKDLWPSQELSLSITTRIPNLQMQASANSANLHSQSSLREFAGIVESRPYLLAAQAVLRMKQGGAHSITYNCDEPEIVGRIEMQGMSGATEVADCLRVVDEHLKLTSYMDLVGGQAVTAGEQQALQIRERSVADMHTATAKLGDLLARIAVDDAASRKKLNEELERDYRKKADDAAADHQNKLVEVEQRRQANDDAYAERVRVFEEREKTFETGEAKFMRRDMLKKLQEILKESETLELSEETRKKRTIVHFAILALAAAAATAAWVMGSRFLAEPKADWHYGLPMATGTITLFATLVYYVKWNDRWFREHSEGELAARRYRADIVRANWLAELVSERAQASDDLPPELLEAYTRGLFHGSTAIAEAEHPFEQITGLIRRAKKLEVGGGKFLVDLGKRKEKPKAED